MIISITGKHESVTDTMKEYAEKKIRAIVEDKHKINKAIIVLSVEKNRQKAEFIVHGKHLDIEADTESFDMHESIDCAVAKIERQVEKHFDKIQDHHKTGKYKKPSTEDVDVDDYEIEIELELEELEGI